jgi:polyisoprenoid-binding protein YceI
MSVTEARTTGTTTWTIDPSHTLVEFSARHMMITTVKGRFAGVSGTIRVDHAHPERSSVEVEMETASIDTRTEQRDQHLRSADFLDVESHPVVSFRGTRVEGQVSEPGDEFRVHGELTIRGTSREVVLDAVFEGTGTDPWGGERASFSARGKIDRRDFGLTWNAALETGGVLVSNEIRIAIEAQATKAE